MLINDFTMNGPGQPLFYRGDIIPLTKGERTVVWSLLKNYPQPLSVYAISERLGNEPEDADASIKVLVCRIRKKMREAGAPASIATLRHAYMWSTGAEYVAATTLTAA